MSVVTSRELVLHAQKNGYAVPAINTQGGNYDIIRAVCEAAEECKSPIILAMYVGNVHYYGMDWFAHISRYFAEKLSVPVAIHLDHGDTFDNCMKAIACNFSSVMIDCSHESIADNILHTNEVITVAHAKGVSVEAEVGQLLRLDADGQSNHTTNLASSEDVQAFLNGCSPDMLAIGIGNAHGYYKGRPQLQFDVLQGVGDITDIPLVLHGATGIPDEDIQKAIRMGVCKINFGTLVRYKLMDYYQEIINAKDHKGHIWMVAQQAELKLKEDIKAIIRLSGAENRV